MKDAAYTVRTEQLPSDQALKVSVSLYPEQVRLIRYYATESRRSFSNALQFIIDDWAKQQQPAEPEAA